VEVVVTGLWLHMGGNAQLLTDNSGGVGLVFDIAMDPLEELDVLWVGCGRWTLGTGDMEMEWQRRCACAAMEIILADGRYV
jgi:hypothetical protein